MVVTPERDARPRLRRSVDARITEDGRIFILRGPDHPDLTLEADPRYIGAFLRLLDGSRTVDELARNLREQGFRVDKRELSQAIDLLQGAGVVDDAAADERFLSRYDVERYQRQLAYFADLEPKHPSAEIQRRLLDATVCMLGLGGIGSWVAWALASAGVGRIVGVDRDRVELSNLNRQILFSEADLGRSKAEAATEPLRAFNGRLQYRAVHAELDSTQAVERVIEGADVVVSSVDWPPHKIERWVNEACFQLGIPYISMSQHPPHIRCGPFYLPGITGCGRCRERAYREQYPLYAVLEAAEQPVAPSATFGPACGVVGTLAANDVVAHLGGLHSPATVGRALTMDLRTGKTTVEDVTKRPDCELCSMHQANRHATVAPGPRYSAGPSSSSSITSSVPAGPREPF